MMLCCFLSLHARPCPARPRAARAGPGPISLFLFMRRNVASEGKGSEVTRAVKTNSLLRQWQLWCPWLSRHSEFKSEPCRGAPLITEEVARAEGDGRSWLMDATAFEFVYLSFVNSMFLSTFALLCPSARLVACLFVCLWLAFLHFPFPIPQSHCHCRSHSPALACKHSAANWIRFNLFTAQTKRGEFCLCDAANNNMKPRFMVPTSTSKDSMDSSIRKRNRFPFAIAWTRFSGLSLFWIYAKTVSIHQMLPAAWSRLFNYKTQWMWNGALTCSMPGSIYPAQLLQ